MSLSHTLLLLPAPPSFRLQLQHRLLCLQCFKNISSSLSVFACFRSISHHLLSIIYLLSCPCFHQHRAIAQSLASLVSVLNMTPCMEESFWVFNQQIKLICSDQARHSWHVKCDVAAVCPVWLHTAVAVWECRLCSTFVPAVCTPTHTPQYHTVACANIKLT